MTMKLPPFLVALVCLFSACSNQQITTEKLKVCASTPDVASLVEFIGGDLVEVFCFTKGMEDPHGVELRASFVTQANEADLLFVNGMDVEHSWIDDLAEGSSNSKIFEGGDSYVDLSKGASVIEELGHLEAEGVHSGGNPHYILDPVEGIRAAYLIKEALVKIQAESADEFESQHKEFLTSWVDVMLGEEIAQSFEPGDLAKLSQMDQIEDYIESLTAKDPSKLGGIYKVCENLKGTKIVGDHDLWVYFAGRFGLEIIGYIEDQPGVPPSPRHLANLINDMKEMDVKLILRSPYFAERFFTQVQQATAAKIVPVAHQVKGAIQAEDYLSLFVWNVKQIEDSLK